MERLPYENVVASLIVHRDTPGEIIGYLAEKEFSMPKNIGDLCRRVSMRLRSDFPHYFEDPKKPPPDDGLLVRSTLIGLYDSMFVHPTDDPMLKTFSEGFDGAMKILEDARMRRIVQSMALADIDQDDIELLVNARYDFNYTSQDIQFYLKHFFNVKGWRMPEKKIFVAEELNDDFRKMYDIALKGDKQYLLWKLGLSPNKSYNEMMQEMMNDAFFLFKENSKNARTADNAYRWSQVALKLAEKLEKNERDESDTNNLFQNLEFDLKAPNTPKQILTPEQLGEDFPDFDLETQAPTEIPKLKELENDARETA